MFVHHAGHSCRLHLILCFAMTIAISVPVPAETSQVFSLTISGQPVPVEHYKKIHYARFTLERAAAIAVNAREPIRQCRLSPEALSLKPALEGARAAFTITPPAMLRVLINDAEPLFLFAEPPEKDIPDLKDSLVHNIASTGIDATGAKVVTESIQRAIDALPRGAVLYFPPGVYLIGMIRLKSDMTLYLAEGATLLGTPDLAAYPEDKIGRRMVLLDGAQNVAIRGRGAIDGNGRRLREATQGRAHLLTIARSRDITIEDVFLRDAGSWNTHIIGSDRVTVRGVKLISDPEISNTDGFDPDASNDVLLENNFVYCGDDGVAVKSTGHDGLGRDVKNVIVRGNVFLTRKSALKVGTESRAARMGDITFENNDVLHCDRGMALYCNDGATYENIRYVNNRFEDNYPDAKRRMIDFSITARAGKGVIRDVLIEDCTFKAAFPQASTIEGLDAEHPVTGVRIEGLSIAGKPCATAAEAGIKPGKFVENISFK